MKPLLSQTGRHRNLRRDIRWFRWSYRLRAFALVLIASPALAAHYYVSPHGNDANPGTEAAPWRTLDKAAGAVSPGDTVWIKGSADPNAPEAIYDRGGKDGLPLVTPGLPGKSITFAAYPGHTVILEGDGSGDGIALDDSSYHILRGLIFRNFNKAAEGWAPKTDVLIEDCEFTKTFETGLRLREVRNFTLRNVYVHHCWEAGISVRNGVNVTFENVESSYNSDGRGIDGDGDGFHVLGGENIQFINCKAKNNTEDGFDLTANATLINVESSGHPACNIKVWRRDRDGFAMKTVTIKNSVIYGAGECGIKISRGPQVNLYNSVIYGNGEEGVAFRGIGITQGPASVPSRLVNNIIAKNGLGGVEVLQSGPNINDVQADNNLYFHNGRANKGTASDTNAVSGQDPQFFGAVSGNFHLRSASPAIDRGMALAEVTTDFDDQNRPFGAGVDIGADERVEIAGNTPPQIQNPPSAPLSVLEGNTLRLTVTAWDAQGHAPRFFLLGGDLVPEMKIDEKSGEFTFQPTFNEGGDNVNPSKTYRVTLGVTDEFYAFPPTEATITIEVRNLNRAPVYTGLDRYYFIENRPMAFSFSIEEKDSGDPLSMSLSGLPAGAFFDSTTANVYWTPRSNQLGDHLMTLSLSDGIDGISPSVTFSVLPEAPYRTPADESVIFYVDGQKGNDANDGQTPSSAWKTFKAASTHLQPGEMVLIRGGTYAETVDPASGTEGKPVIYKAYPGESVLLDGATLGSSPSGIIGRSNLVVDGFTLQNYSETFDMRRNPNNVVMMNCTVESSTNYGIYAFGGDNLRVENVTLKNIADRGYLGAGTNVHFYNVRAEKVVDRGISIYNEEADNIQVLNSEFAECGTRGILLGAKSGAVINSKIHDNAGTGLSFGIGGGFIINTLVYRTRLRGGSARNVFLSDGARGTILHALFTQSERYGLVVAATASSARMVNSIVVNNADREYVDSSRSFEEESNVIFDANSDALFDPQSRFYRPAGPGTLNQDPLFVDAANSDFRSQTGSPAIDSGADLSSRMILYDFNGYRRPFGLGVDRGPYEFGSTQKFIDGPLPSDPGSPPGTTDPNPNGETGFQRFINVIKKGRTATITFQLASPNSVDLRIFDLRGNEVRTLLNGPHPAGPGAVDWDGINNAGARAASGVYLLVLNIGDQTYQKKIIVVK